MNGRPEPWAIRVREERDADAEAITTLNLAAFGGAREAELVAALRARVRLVASLVAEHRSAMVGHIAFSPVRIEACPRPLSAVALGPMAVLPAFQRQGVGSLLVKAGLDLLRKRACDCVVVLGHPDYYPRFGFIPAERLGLICPWPLPAGVFMALELRAGALAGVKGMVRYEPEFDGV